MGDVDRPVPSGIGRATGAGELCATVGCCSWRRSIVTAAKKTKTPAAASPKPSEIQFEGVFVKRHRFDLVSDTDAPQANLVSGSHSVFA